MRIGCFRRTRLLECTKSDSDDDIKPQDIVSTIVTPDSHESETFDTNVEFANPTETFILKTENAHLHAADIYPDGVAEDES